MRTLGVEARGIRLPIVKSGDDLAAIVTEYVINAGKAENIVFRDFDIIGITEAIVAKAQGNFATVEELSNDIKSKFGSGTVGLVFPILSRNRFLNILKGVAKGCEKLIVLLKYPNDEVGNPLMDIDKFDEIEPQINTTPISAADFKKLAGEFSHPFTGVDYVSLYESVSPNIEVYLSNDPRDILKLTKNVLVAEIHERNRTKRRLLGAGAQTVYTLSDILVTPSGSSGFNADYGVLGSNIFTTDSLKLFPRDCTQLVNKVRSLLKEKLGVTFEVLVYGDGAFKDPSCGIWELADPVVSPGHTEKLGGMPNEIKLKYIVESEFSDLSTEQREEAVKNYIKTKKMDNSVFREGTTPRKYADLVGSLCDLVSGSGDKGTPVVLIQGYFDNYADN